MEENVLDWLEQSAEKYHDNVFVDDGEKEVTFGQLLERAKRIGYYLSNKIAPKNPIVILSPKSSDILTIMMACVYAGDYYVMIDPSQPVQRLEGFLTVLGAKLVITDKKYDGLLAEANYQEEVVHIQEFEAILSGEYHEEVEDKLKQIRQEFRQEDILYGLFTSGSTGTPKAIAVSHKCVLDFIPTFAKEFGFSSFDVIGNQAPFDFDVSVKDIYTAMLTGAKMVLIPKEYFTTPPILLDFICDKEVTSLTWAVSALTMISALKGFRYRIPDKICRVMFSGEVMPAKQLKIWQEAIPNALYVNLYGPTEITCNCSFYKLDGFWHEKQLDKLPVGEAFKGREIFLLDEEDQVVTCPHQSGEICVTGQSVALGYINNEEETKKHFVYYKLRDKECYSYRTGDLGYWDEDGLLYFNGRKDFQIKYMGHRIELEEIERAIMCLSGIERCCCLMDEKRKRLVAFYMGEAEEDGIKDKLKESLPTYMVPHTLKKQDCLPLTKNGKTDRNRLKELL